VLEGSLTITNSTISGNTATIEGGGFFNIGSVDISSSTISGNTSSDGAGGIANVDGAVAIVNTILADNTGGDCSGVAVTSNGHNLDSDDTCGLAGTGDQSGVDPLLAALALNAPGSTETHALPAESPAVDAGDDAACPATDQRGVDRPQDGDEGGAGTAVCDIGAYELVPDADNDGVLDAFDACVNVPEDIDGIEDTDGCPEAPVQPTPTPAQLPETGGTPTSDGNGLALTLALAAGAMALLGAGGALVAVRRKR